MSSAASSGTLRRFGIPLATAAPLAVISDAEQLGEFAASREFVSKRPLIVLIPGMAESEAFAASERLNAYRAECGCSLGARAMTAAFLISLALLMFSYGVFTLALLVRLPIALAAGVVSAMLGKLAGIAMGRRRAHREAARILAMLTDRS
jgi:hypothetical protein